MRLYSLPMSAFAARCRVTIREKRLDVEVVSPPGGLSSEAFAAITPLKRVPVLELDDGASIFESDVICEYLDEQFPAAPQRPTDTVERARMRSVIRIVDNYVAQHIGGVLRAAASGGATDESVAAYRAGLGNLAHVMAPEGFAMGDRVTLADGTIATMMYIAYAALPTAGVSAFDDSARIKAFMRLAAARPEVREVLLEQCADLPPPLRPHGERFFAEFSG